jgi:hypothetical protein
VRFAGCLIVTNLIYNSIDVEATIQIFFQIYLVQGFLDLHNILTTCKKEDREHNLIWWRVGGAGDTDNNIGALGIQGQDKASILVKAFGCSV